MTNTVKANAVLIIALFLVSFGSLPASAQYGETAEFLQQFPRDFARKDLLQDITFSDENGTLQSGVRCATRSIGSFEQTMIEAAIGDLVAIQGRAHRFSGITVPIAFHVVRTSEGAGHVKKKQIKRQVRVLNRAYGKHGIRFKLQTIRRHQSDEFASGCMDKDIENKFKSLHAVDPAHTLNVYTCIPEDGSLGYSYLPVDFTEDSYMHGVVQLYSTLPKGATAPFNLGHTLTHEVGHYLGLYHTFQGSCSDGDLVADTPAEQSPAYGCPTERDTCSGPGADPVWNFMNYTDDACMKQFTPGQGERMLDMIATFRPSLLP